DQAGEARFCMAVVFNLSESIGFQKVKSLMQNAALLKKYFSGLQEVEFATPGPDGKYDFNLTVGEFSEHFVQSFQCSDTNEAPTNWLRTCIEKAPTSSSVLVGTQIITHCFVTPNSSSANGD